MKSFVVSLIIAVGIICGSAGYSIYIKDLADELCVIEEEIKELIEEGEAGGAEKEILGLKSLLEDKKVMLASTADHGIIEEIEKTLAELAVYAEGGQRYDALAKCEVLSMLFEHLPKSYGLCLENIL